MNLIGRDDPAPANGLVFLDDAGRATAERPVQAVLPESRLTTPERSVTRAAVAPACFNTATRRPAGTRARAVETASA